MGQSVAFGSRLRFLAAAAISCSSLCAANLPRERITYTTLRPANWDLFLFAGKHERRQLTNDPALDYDATFSPDGKWIVFCSERSGNPDLYALDLEHRGAAQQLTRDRFMEAAPAFTPDGKSLLFVSDRDGNADIFAMPFRPNESKTEQKAINLTKNSAGDFRPAVSPDGKTVAFSSDRDSWREWMSDTSHTVNFRAEIYLMNLDGAEVRRLTTANAVSGSPAWARDGKTIYFYSSRDGGAFRIWAMDNDGGHQRALSPKERPALSPAVMSDGRVAFAEQTKDGSQITSMAPDGTDLRGESGTQPGCGGPAIDWVHQRMVCSGQGSLAGMLLISNGRPFLARGAHEEVQLPDRIVELQGVHRQFCSSSPDGREFVSGQLVTAKESND
ncbi:MAG TPA: hypothetical protein VGH90_10710, partial [Chthoniobacteraceae bacterium]